MIYIFKLFAFALNKSRLFKSLYFPKYLDT